MKSKSFRLALCIVLSVLFSSCRGEGKEIATVIKHYQKKNIVFDKELERCLILPEVGCGGCIASGVSFFKENNGAFSNRQKKNKIVFTAISSKKMLLRTLELSSLEDYSSVLDMENDYLVSGNNAIYPLILHLKNGEIVKAEYQSPHSGNVIKQLEHEIKNEK